MSDDASYHATITLARGYEFVADFPDLPNGPSILFDEPPPLGENRAPNAAALVGAAVDCLAASLAFCLRKSRVAVDDLRAHVVTHVNRNERGKLRITGIDVELVPAMDAPAADRLRRCEELFEDFCIVTQSVRQGIPVSVKVRDRVAV